MIRWGRITGVCLAVFCLLAPAANAAPLGKAVLGSAIRRRARPSSRAVRRALRQTKMQMKFTLQVGQGKREVAQGRRRRLRRVDHRAERLRQVHVREDRAGAAAGLELPDRGDASAGATRRAGRCGPSARRRRCAACPRRGRTWSCAASPTTRRATSRRSSTAVARRPARSTSPSSSAASRWARRGWSGWRPGSRSTSSCPAPRARTARRLEAVVDPGSEVDESNEENDSLVASC